MIDYIKDPQTAIFIGPKGCAKSHLVLDMIEKKCNKHLDYIIIICPKFLWNRTYQRLDQA